MSADFAVLTPDKVVITYRLAGAGSRVMAHFLDLIFVMVLMMISNFAFAILTGVMAFLSLDSIVRAAQIIISTFMFFLYFMLCEARWNGQTLGKKLIGLRVRMLDGTPVSPSAAIYRNLLRPADFLPFAYLIGLLAIFTNSRSQRIGDLAAGTIVVAESKTAPYFQPSPHSFGLHPFEEHVGDLRGMTAEEYAAIKRLCDRFATLTTATQDRLLSDVWRPFQARRSVASLPDVHPVYLMEAVVMKYGRQKGIL